TRAEVKNAILLVLTSNRGLCGGYNASIIRDAIAENRRLRGENVKVHLELSGKRAIAYFRFQGIKAEQTYTHFEAKPTFEEVNVLAQRYVNAYIRGEVDRVEVAYMKFLNAGVQKAVVETLLPLSSVPGMEKRGKGVPVSETKMVEYEFVPDAKGILEE